MQNQIGPHTGNHVFCQLEIHQMRTHRTIPLHGNSIRSIYLRRHERRKGSD